MWIRFLSLIFQPPPPPPPQFFILKIYKQIFIFSGEPVEDQEVQRIVKEILKIANSFPEHFDESAMFQGDQQQALQLRVGWTNITRYKVRSKFWPTGIGRWWFAIQLNVMQHDSMMIVSIANVF